ncbi:hypothetical protein GOP47_0020946 [Adiantum capillus-veneris]|uniref:Thioredoxin domain-containing protein n=1 Tax=Adiantum capillus-veneris TaxID=13818 RepID=A0A9D4UC02_ADICA|nr:hypothetical protein GOP47_0020946 [Adiantum capillus-veneris]
MQQPRALLCSSPPFCEMGLVLFSYRQPLMKMTPSFIINNKLVLYNAGTGNMIRRAFLAHKIMAQCHAERRKHPSAMDFYVGALHTKLYNPSRDVDKYPHWPSYNNNTASTTSSGDPSCTRSSQSFRKEPSAGSRPSFGGSFRESALMVGACPELKSASSRSYTDAPAKTPQKSHGNDAKLVQKPTLARMNNTLQHEHDKSTTKCLPTLSNGAPIDKVIASSTTKVSNLNSMKIENEDSLGCPRQNAARNLQPTVNETQPLKVNSTSLHNHGLTMGASAGGQSRPGNVGEISQKPTLAVKPNHGEPATSFPRGHKSAEQGASFANKDSWKTCNMDAGSRLYKSGEQIAAKFTLASGNLRESPTGGLIVGSQNVVGNGSGDSFSTNGGSPTATKDGPRWSSSDSIGSVDLSHPHEESPTSKDGARKASSVSCSSDGGSPMSKGLQINETKGTDRRPSSVSVLNNKDATPVRGMGNILVGASNNGVGKGKFSNNKAGANDIKPGDGSSKKVEDLAPMSNIANLRGPAASATCADGVMNRNMGNLCHGSRNSSAPSGNILNTGMAPRALNQQLEGTRNGFELVDPEDIKNAGNAQYKMGHFSEALALYDKSIGICPNYAPYRSNRAAALAGLGRVGEAVLECEEAIKLDPQYLRAHQRAAHLYLRLGMIESAKRLFRASMGKDETGVPQTLHAVERHISRCIEARKAGDWRIVFQESSAAVVAGADSAAQVLGYKSEALLKLHRLEEADGICTEAQRQESILQKLGVAPADSFLVMLRAHIQMYLGRFESALGAAEAAAKIDPRNVEIAGFVKRARAVIQTRTSGNELFKAGRFFEACAVYSEGLESDPMNAILLCNRAACRSKLGQWEKAIEDCDAALQAQPNYIKAFMRRAHCSSKLERWEDALQDYEVLRAKMPSDVEVARGYFDVQVAIKKSRGEEIHKMKFGGEVEEVFNEGQLREVVTFAGISVVQFITRWNDRCGQISPFIDQLCKRFPCVHFVKVDVEDNPYLAKIESVTFVPTFKIYRSGQRVKELQGPSEQALENAIKHYSL